MAEDVNVIGTPGLKAWASEATLASILTVLQEAHKISDAQLKELQKSKTEISTNLNETFGDIEAAIQDLEGSTEDLMAEIEGLGEAADKAKDETEDLGESMKKFNIGVLTPLIGGMGLLAGAITNQMNMVTSLNESGLNLGRNVDGAVGGFNSFVTSATEANLTMSELAEISKKYGTMMNNIGVKQFGPMAKSLTADLRGLGVTSSEGAELLAEYLEQQQTLGVTNRMSQQEQTKQAAKQIKQADLWGKTLGLSRKEMLEQMKGMKENVDVNAFLNRSSANVQQAFEQMQMGLSGFDANTSTSIMQSLAAPIIQTSDLFNQLNDAGMAEAANELVNMQKIVTDPNVDPKAAEKAMDDFLKVMASQDTALAQIIGDSDIALSLVQEAKVRGLLTKAQESELAAQQEQAAAMAKATDTWKMFTNIFDRAIGQTFGDEALVAKINGALEGMATAFEAIVPPILEAASVALDILVPVLTTLADIVGGAVSGISDFADAIGPKGVLALAVTAMAAKMMIAAKGGLGSMFGGGSRETSTRGPSGGGAGMLGSVGKGIGDLGKGIGKGIGGIFKGLAMGLASFANPAILAGATIFAGAIAIISTGLAASVAVIGVALPLLSEGLDSFAGIDAKHLSAIGAGMTELAKGAVLLGPALAIFAVGGAIAGVGAVISGVADAFLGLLGVESPVDQLMRFAEVGDQLQSAGIGVLALSKGLSGMSEAVASLPELDILNQIVDATNRADPSKMTAFADAMSKTASAPVRLEIDDTALQNLGSVEPEGFIKLVDSLGIVMRSSDPFTKFVDDFAKLSQTSTNFDVDSDDFEELATGINYFGDVNPSAREEFTNVMAALKGITIPNFDAIDGFDDEDMEELVQGINYFDDIESDALTSFASVMAHLKDVTLPSFDPIDGFDDEDMEELVQGINYFASLDPKAVEHFKLATTELEGAKLPSFGNIDSFDDEIIEEYTQGINYFKDVDPTALAIVKALSEGLSSVVFPDFANLINFDDETTEEYVQGINYFNDLDLNALANFVVMSNKLKEVTFPSFKNLDGFDDEVIEEYVQGINYFNDLDLNALANFAQLRQITGLEIPDFSRIEWFDDENMEELVDGINYFEHLNPVAFENFRKLEGLADLRLPKFPKFDSEFTESLLSIDGAVDALVNFDTDTVSEFVTAMNSLNDMDLAGLDKLVQASFKLTRAAGNLESVDTEMLARVMSYGNTGASGTIKEKKPSSVQIPYRAEEREKGTKPTTKDQVGNPANKELNVKESEINTILARQTELLEMILVNSSSQLDNVKKLRRSSEERT